MLFLLVHLLDSVNESLQKASCAFQSITLLTIQPCTARDSRDLSFFDVPVINAIISSSSSRILLSIAAAVAILSLVSAVRGVIDSHHHQHVRAYTWPKPRLYVNESIE